jgi:cell division protein FtsB
MSSDKSSQSSHKTHEWMVTYTQSDVDTIREQIEQGEAAKRRFLFLTLIVTAAALAGAIILLVTSYSLYSSGQSARNKLAEDYASLKKGADETAAELSKIKAREADDARARSEAQARLSGVLPTALAGGGRDVSTLAEMVYSLPDHQVQVGRKPPDELFRNWKVHAGGVTSVYTLVGGFVDGKWVIYSNLVARRSADEAP